MTYHTLNRIRKAPVFVVRVLVYPLKIAILPLVVLALLVSVVLFGAGYVLSNSFEFQICFSDPVTRTYDVACHDMAERIGTAMYYGFGALSVIFLALIAYPQAFLPWKRFAIWFVPLAALLFIVYPDPGSGDLFAPYSEQVFQWISGLYILISLAIVGRVLLRGKKN